MNQLDKDFWTQRYQEGSIGWNIGEVSSPIKAYVDQLRNKDLAILIPGAGFAHEAKYLIKSGFTNVNVIDIAKPALDHVRDAIGESPFLNLIEGDFFNHHCKYDLILEQTFFCALEPGYRSKYVSHTYELMSKEAKLVGVLFNRIFDKIGPPFGGTISEYIPLFSKHFSKVYMEPCYNSIPPRQGSECFIILEK